MNTMTLNKAPSSEKMAANLEGFELKIMQAERDNALGEIEELKAQLKAKELAHVDEISAIKKGEGVITDPLQAVIDAYHRVPLLEQQLAEALDIKQSLVLAFDAAEEDKTQLAEVVESQSTFIQLQKKKLDETQVACKDAVRQLENTGIVLQRDKQTIKELKALNPKKLVTANKGLQAKNKELNEANSRHKKMISGLRKQFEQLEKDYSTLQLQKDAIDAGFSKLHEDINAGTVTDVLETIGEWQICSHASRHDAFYIVDTKTDIVRPYSNGDIPKARAIPQAVKDATLVISERNKTAAANLGFMQGAA